jgi:hypothetical protein
MSNANRSRGKRRSSDRIVGKVEPIQTFLIVCEGRRTEPNYFRAFRVPANVQVQIEGKGYNTLSLVERAVVLAAEQSYDQVWCVFDRDSFPVDSFNSALALARLHSFHVAYSNEAFELWYLLHYHYVRYSTYHIYHPVGKRTRSRISQERYTHVCRPSLPPTGWDPQRPPTIGTI